MSMPAANDDLKNLYQELIIDHAKSPRHFHVMDKPTHHAEGNNPSCGDRLMLFLALDDGGRIKDASFTGKGCAISTASASLLTERVLGKTKTEAEALFHYVHHLCTGKTPEIQIAEDDADYLNALGGVQQYPMRVKCATLAWHTLEAALSQKQQVSTE